MKIKRKDILFVSLLVIYFIWLAYFLYLLPNTSMVDLFYDWTKNKLISFFCFIVFTLGLLLISLAYTKTIYWLIYSKEPPYYEWNTKKIKNSPTKNEKIKG